MNITNFRLFKNLLSNSIEKPGIFNLKVLDDKSIYMLLDASSAGNIKPSQVLEAYAEYLESSVSDFSFIKEYTTGHYKKGAL